MADLVSISKEMEAAYSAGSRSVAVTFTVDGKRLEQLYHFSKIRLFVHINNYQVAVQSAHDSVHHFSTSSIISSGFFSAFITLPILSAIRGLRGSTFPLWKLSCLLREEWLHEDAPPKFSNSEALQLIILIYPTTFLADLRYLFNRFPRLFSLDLIALRQRLQSTLIDKFSHSDASPTITPRTVSMQTTMSLSTEIPCDYPQTTRSSPSSVISRARKCPELAIIATKYSHSA
ncbi:hypothetical protein C8J57DRAFT_1548550 [Mycena rebaudengoi]|nr:hypothetical protein C8J57DRAFT_1548550 [Mycena rebaudengoi]